MFEIQKGIPIPESRGRPCLDHGYPFDSMDVGDSFAVPVDPGTTRAAVQKHVMSVACGPKHRKNQKYVTRSVVEDGRVVVRVWRTA